MSVTERLMGVGSWSLRLRPDTPGQIRDRLLLQNSGYGHVVITPSWADLGNMSDAEALGMSRYTGIYTRRDEEPLELSGMGANAWLGEDSKRGRSVGSLPTSGTFSDYVSLLVGDGYLTAGITSSIPGTYTRTYVRTTFRDVADDIAKRFSAEWRVTNDFKLDFGTTADLFRTTPIALVTRHAADAGRGLGVVGLPGELGMVRDVEDWAWRILYWYGSSLSAVIIQDGGVADHDVPFRGPTGGPANVDQIIEHSNVGTFSDATAYSTWNWNDANKSGGVRNEMRLSSDEYDIGRDVAVGDSLYVFDMERGIYNLGNPVDYRGQTIYPDVIRCVGYSWPVQQGMGVWFRRWVKGVSSWSVEWFDLTPYVVWERSGTTVEVGALPRRPLS